MDDEPFRSLLSTGWLVQLSIMLFHRVRSQMTRERLDRRQEGIPMLIGLRLVGLVNVLGIIAYLTNPPSMAWASLGLPRGLRWVGIALAGAAAAMLTWTLVSLGRNLTDTVVTRRAHTLVSHGPYRWVRHPFYVFVALSLIGTAVASSNWFHLVAALCMFAMFWERTATEEAKLIERFGDAYRDYAAHTGRFLPRRH
jgi:protein-S-isoprenylcysteine O-methyltransferase Ste14